MRKIILKINRKHSSLENAEIILNQEKQQMIFILLFSVFYLLRDLAGVAFPDILFSGLCALGFLMMDKGTCLGVYMFTTTLTVPHNEIILVYIILLLAKMLLAGRTRMNGKMVIMTIGMLLLQFVNMTLYSTSSVGGALYDYVTRMLIIIVPLFWYDADYSAEDFRSALMCYAAGVMLGGTVTMIITADLITWDTLLKGTGDYRLGYTYNMGEGMQTTYNANQLAVMFAIAIAILLQRMDDKRMSKLIGFALVGYSMFLVVLTRSRTGLLTIAMIILIYYFVLVVRRGKIFAGVLLLGALVAIVLMVMKIMPDVVERVINRFVDQEDISNGRTELFIGYIKAWISSPWCFFFGYGIRLGAQQADVGSTPHNAIADILISWGLIGMILVCGVAGMCLNRGIKNINKKERIMALLPAIVALIASMAGQYLDTSYPHPRLCFLFLAAKASEIVIDNHNEKHASQNGTNRL